MINGAEYSLPSCSQLVPRSALTPSCGVTRGPCRKSCILPGCWCPSAGAGLGWEDPGWFHRSWERRMHGHELLVCSWTRLERAGRERREAQKPNEYSRGRRQINLTRKLCITCFSLIVSPSPTPFSCPVHTSGSLCTFSQSLPAC